MTTRWLMVMATIAGAASWAAGAQGENGSLLRQLLQADSCRHSSLALPEKLPVTLRLPATLDGKKVELILARHAIRAASFRVVFRQEDGSFDDVATPPPSTYSGYVAQEPNRAVLACLTAAGLKVKANGGGRYDVILPLEAVLQTARDVQVGQGPPSEAARGKAGEPTTDPAGGSNGQGPATEPEPLGARRSGPWTFKSVTIAWDVDHEFFQNREQDIDRCVADVELFCADLDLAYTRDALTRHLCGTIVIGYEGEPTSRFDHENRWLSYDRKVFPHHAACMMAEGGGGSGGIAQVNQIGGWIPYTSSWFQDYTCFKHEIGHVWGANDYEDPWPWKQHAMRGDTALLAQNLHDVVLRKRDEIGAPEAAAYPTPVRPYGCPDVVKVKADQERVKIDVLANDHDANSDPIHLAAFDEVSAAGVALARSIGTGPQGRDELAYVLPTSTVAPYEDTFWYTVEDNTARSHRTGVKVLIEAMP